MRESFLSAWGFPELAGSTESAGELGGEGRENLGDDCVDNGAIGFASDLWHEHSHDLALVAGTYGPDFLDYGLDNGADLIFAHLLGEVTYENCEFNLFFGDEIFAVG
jgi:hypothetical protein